MTTAILSDLIYARILDPKGFRRLSDNRPADLSRLTDDDFDSLFYKEIPYDGKKFPKTILFVDYLL